MAVGGIAEEAGVEESLPLMAYVEREVACQSSKLPEFSVIEERKNKVIHIKRATIGAFLFLAGLRVCSLPYSTIHHSILQNGFQYSRSEFEEVTCCGATTDESSKAQTNQVKLIHYVATLREKLENLAEEKTPDGLPRISKATINKYSEQIEAIAAKLVVQESNTEVSEGSSGETPFDVIPIKAVDNVHSLDGLRRRIVSPSVTEDKSRDTIEDDQSTPVKLDAATQTLIQKHRKLQDDLTDEMVGLAQELKERSLLMSQSVRTTERILDSTEKAIEHSLASTGHANTRAGEVYSRSSKTSCFTWLMMFAMTFVFIMVVLLIRVT